MKKLIITADIHGSFSSWLALADLLTPDDTIAIAGDLFDTVYGNYSHADFQPESIKKDLKTFTPGLQYAYGNCDNPSFYPGFNHYSVFSMFQKTIFMHHGHRSSEIPDNTDIIIQGHTHLCSLEKNNGRIYFNPGTIVSPRNGLYTYGVMDQNSISLVDFKTHEKLSSIYF